MDGALVLTVAGNSMVSRQAAAVLQGVGCDEWICHNETELVEKALYLLMITTTYNSCG